MCPCHPVRVPSGGSDRLFKLVAGGVRRVDHVGGRPVSLSLGFSIRYVCDC